MVSSAGEGKGLCRDYRGFLRRSHHQMSVEVLSMFHLDRVVRLHGRRTGTQACARSVLQSRRELDDPVRRSVRESPAPATAARGMRAHARCAPVATPLLLPWERAQSMLRTTRGVRSKRATHPQAKTPTILSYEETRRCSRMKECGASIAGIASVGNARGDNSTCGDTAFAPSNAWISSCRSRVAAVLHECVAAPCDHGKRAAV